MVNMYDAKSQVAKKLAEISGVNVAASHEMGMKSIPCIIYSEADNRPVSRASERLVDAVYKIDVYSNTSTTSIVNSVITKMDSLGLIRDFCQDLDDPSGLRHKTMRFKGIIDTQTEIVYQ